MIREELSPSASGFDPARARGLAARTGSASRAIAAAALTEFVFDVGFSAARGTDLNLAYLALCGALMVAASIVCVGLGALIRGFEERVALALYVLAHAFYSVSTPGVGTSPVTAVLMALVAWIFLSPSVRFGLGAVGRGVVIGSALCIALVVRPYAVIATGIYLPEPEKVQILAFALALALASGWQFARTQAPALPSPAVFGIGGIALSIAAMAIGVERTRPQVRSMATEPAAISTPRLPDVFLIVLDTVRADHLSTYGYERDTTPNLVRFLAEHPEAVQYDFAFSTATWTIPAHGSLLSGTMQSVHGARGYTPIGTITFSADQTLGEVMRDAGYCTAAVVANPFLLRVKGFRRGFEAYFQPPATRPLLLLGEGIRFRFLPSLFAGRVRPQPLADVINGEVERIHRECAPRPAFLFVNYMDAHAPFLAPSPHAGMFAGLEDPELALDDAAISDSDELIALKVARYDEEIHFLDEQLRRLFDRLESEGTLQESWLIITADHGEAFGEHGATSHGSGIYNEEVRVPLIVKPPRGVRLETSRGAVSLLDVAATVAGVAGQPGFGAGNDLRSPPDPTRAVQIDFQGSFRGEERYGRFAGVPAQATVSGHFKLLRRGGSYELYDLASDPHELVDRNAESEEIVQRLVPKLPHHKPSAGKPEEPATDHTLSLDEQETLRALGYFR